MILSDIQCVSAKQILFCRTGEMLGESHMSIYTKNGDKGTTNLVHTKNVSKSDDRIQLEGTIDEPRIPVEIEHFNAQETK